MKVTNKSVVAFRPSPRPVCSYACNPHNRYNRPFDRPLRAFPPYLPIPFLRNVRIFQDSRVIGRVISVISIDTCAHATRAPERVLSPAFCIYSGFLTMSNSLSRGGRRRRVLNEEMVAASGTHAANASASTAQASVSAATYGEAAASENHARVSDFAPRRSGTLWFAGILGMVGVGTLAALDYFSPALTGRFGLEPVRALNMSAPGSLASWYASVVLLIASASCLLIYSLRQHKLADYRGRYRIWLWAALLGTALSVCSVTNLHSTLAALAAHFAGWTALPNHAAWWLIGGGLIYGWTGYRLLRDLWESRLARGGFLLTGMLLTVSLLTQLQVVTVPGYLDSHLDSQVVALIPPVALLASEVSLLIAIAAYARFVILDADGLLVARKVFSSSSASKKTLAIAKGTTAKESAKETRETSFTTAKQTTRSTSDTTKRRVAKAAPKPAVASRTIEWTDGSTPDSDYGDDRPQKRKLSKSERKSLRKQKTQRRAA